MTLESPMLVSVVIPVGSVDAAVERQLRAVAGQQDPPDFEVVLALNSTDPDAPDHLAAIVSRSLSSERPPVRIVDATDRRGAAHARNVGAGNANGGMLAFCDADDVAHPTWLRQLVEALDGVDAVGGRLIDIDPNPRSRRPPTTPDDLPRFLGVPYIVSANMGIGREVFWSVGGFDETLGAGEDLAISFRLLTEGHTIAFASDAVIDYHFRVGLWQMLRQHFTYGRGVAQVLARHDLPIEANDAKGGDHRRGVRRLDRLRPNSPIRTDLTRFGLLRRGALAAGRVVGTVEEIRVTRRSRSIDRGEMHDDEAIT